MSIFDVAKKLFHIPVGKPAAETAESAAVARGMESYRIAQDIANKSVLAPKSALDEATKYLRVTYKTDNLGPLTRDWYYSADLLDGTKSRSMYSRIGMLFLTPKGWGGKLGWALRDLKKLQEYATGQADAVALKGFGRHSADYRDLAAKAARAAADGQATIKELQGLAQRHVEGRIRDIEGDIESLRGKLAGDPQWADYYQGQIDGNSRFISELKDYHSHILTWGTPPSLD